MDNELVNKGRFWCPECWSTDIRVHGTVRMGQGKIVTRYQCNKCGRTTGALVDSYTNAGVLATLYGWWKTGEHRFGEPYQTIMHSLQCTVQGTGYKETRRDWLRIVKVALRQVNITPEKESVVKERSLPGL